MNSTSINDPCKACDDQDACEFFGHCRFKGMREQDQVPPPFPPQKPFDLEAAKRRDAASPWKKEWNGPGAPEPLISYDEWKKRQPPSS